VGRLIGIAEEYSWEAGHIQAVFRISKNMSHLFDPRLRRLWAKVGVPPGPWAKPPLFGIQIWE
jgi:hypothetical protein